MVTASVADAAIIADVAIVAAAALAMAVAGGLLLSFSSAAVAMDLAANYIL